MTPIIKSPPSLTEIREAMLKRTDIPVVGHNPLLVVPSDFLAHVRLVPEDDLSQIYLRALRKMVDYSLMTRDEFVVWRPLLPHDLPPLPTSLAWGYTLAYHDRKLVSYQLVAYIHKMVTSLDTNPGGCFALVKKKFVGAWNGQPVNPTDLSLN